MYDAKNTTGQTATTAISGYVSAGKRLPRAATTANSGMTVNTAPIPKRFQNLNCFHLARC